MFVIELVYKADLREIDAHMHAHVRFLKKYYASGNLLVSGRKIAGNMRIVIRREQRFPAVIPTCRPRTESSVAASAHSAPLAENATNDRGDRVLRVGLDEFTASTSGKPLAEADASPGN
jgi:uncharacterized protein YciI